MTVSSAAARQHHLNEHEHHSQKRQHDDDEHDDKQQHTACHHKSTKEFVKMNSNNSSSRKWSRAAVILAVATTIINVPQFSESFSCSSSVVKPKKQQSQQCLPQGPLHHSHVKSSPITSELCMTTTTASSSPASSVMSLSHPTNRIINNECMLSSSANLLRDPVTSLYNPFLMNKKKGEINVGSKTAATMLDRYGGRPSSSSSSFENKIQQNNNVLGFQIEPFTSSSSPSSSSFTALEMVSSTPSSADGGKSATNKNKRRKKINLQPRIRPISHTSPIKNSVASSLLLLQQSSAAASLRRNNNKGMSSFSTMESAASAGGGGGQLSISKNLQQQQQRQLQEQYPLPMKVPPWFPWIPTRMQVNSLNVSELREACADRGLIKSGKKAELQERLLEWTKEQHRQRVIDRRLGSSDGNVSTTTNAILSDLSSFRFAANARRKEKESSTTTTDLTKRKEEGEKDIMRSQFPPSLLSSSPSTMEDGIEPLINRRKALMRARNERLKGKQEDEEHSVGSANGRLLDSGSLFPGKKIQGGVGKNDDDDDEEEEDDEERSMLLDSKPADSLIINALKKSFSSPPSQYSNLEVKEMYLAAKHADQDGTNRPLAKQLLLKLLEATPKDSRILRRLSRMEMEEGNVSKARQILQNGLRQNPNNASLFQGLGKIELSSGNDIAARKYFLSAIKADPSFPNPYHALGTLEHSRGRIRVATNILKRGLKNCPSNHRLHYALGDLYRDAGLFDLAESSYRSGLSHGPNWSKPFAYTALSYLAYEKNRDVDACRHWLRRGVSINYGMHSQGWIALAHLEESEELIEEAREVYVEAVSRYERRLASKRMFQQRQKQMTSTTTSGSSSSLHDSKPVLNPVRSGDKWINLYKSWARFEEKHGSYRTANEAFNRGALMFTHEWSLPLQWAQFQVKCKLKERARSLFALACDRAGSSHADPYRLYAEFEMSQMNYSRARSILFLGAQSLSGSSDGGLGNRGDLARLYYTWAVCEWHLGDMIRAEVLFDHALRLTDAGENGSEIRSLIFYAIARLEYARGENLLAQHCVGLSLKENLMPGGNSQIWLLWADIAKAMKNDVLEKECLAQADILSSHESLGATEDLTRLLGLRRKSATPGLPASDSQDQVMTRSAVQKMLRKEPWHNKIFGTSSGDDAWYERVELPDISLKASN